MTAQELPGFEAWGAVRDGQLVASFLAFRCGDCYTLAYEQSATAHLKSRINNAIFYYVTHEALQLDGISRVFFCLRSLDAHASEDEFKFRMGYTAKPVRQRILFHPLLSPVFNTATHAVVKRLVSRQPVNNFLSKVEGMIRVYLEGSVHLLSKIGPNAWWIAR
jgi:hypothetical protein